MKCEGSKRLYYTITGQTLQDPVTCSTPNTCVDRLKFMFPGVTDCERCGSMNNAINNNCVSMGRSGLGNEMMVEFVVNRETEHPGFEMLAHCVEPGFNQNTIPLPSGRKRRQAEECTSPDGIGPRDLPPVPLPVSVKMTLHSTLLITCAITPMIIIFNQRLSTYGLSHLY